MDKIQKLYGHSFSLAKKVVKDKNGTEIQG